MNTFNMLGSKTLEPVSLIYHLCVDADDSY